VVALSSAVMQTRHRRTCTRHPRMKTIHTRRANRSTCTADSDSQREVECRRRHIIGHFGDGARRYLLLIYLHRVRANESHVADIYSSLPPAAARQRVVEHACIGAETGGGDGGTCPPIMWLGDAVGDVPTLYGTCLTPSMTLLYEYTVSLSQIFTTVCICPARAA